MYNCSLEGGTKMNLVNKGEKIFNKFIGFYLLTVFFLWIKTYITQLTQFDLGIENALQQFLLFLNPLGSSMLILGFAFLFKGRRKYTWLMIVTNINDYLIVCKCILLSIF